MQEIPDCLNRRYKALDELVNELNSDVDFNDDVTAATNKEPGVRLMCDFWNILKDNPGCNLTKAVKSRMDMDVSPKSCMYHRQNVSCYVAAHNCLNKNSSGKKQDSGGKVPNVCCHRAPEETNPKCCASKSVSSSQASTDALPLSKVLCNLNEAASFDRKCEGKVNDLMAAQKQLNEQIQHLEHRETEGIQLLKKADCMWSCMEDAYKKKILESQQRQQELIKQLKEAEANTNKWRKNKRDLELQMENVNMCRQEISEKLQQKQNDLKCMKKDIADYEKRVENNKKEIEAAKKAITTKKQASDDRIKKITADIYRLETSIREEKSRKEEKEKKGNQYLKEARADLLNLSKILLQKKIENEDLKIEKQTLIEELEVLAQSYDQCKDRCRYKKKSMEDEIKKLEDEISHYTVKCIRCHQCTDTIDIRKFCTDCPRCVEERDCCYKEDHCSTDHTMDCVCMSVKQKFLDNVFENMYTVLERKIKTGPGKCVAETVLNCLRKSRNGKLDQQTRQILQDFILTTVKKNLNLTIVGGAVKTRCELDADTYKQLMLCLTQVKAVRPPKADKETAAKKPPCPRWGAETECNCPKGPKACVCTKRAPPPPNEPGPCPPEDKEDKGDEKICPHKESAACGPDCAMHAVPSAVGSDIAAWRPDPCKGPTCMFKNMRAAQCVLGPEALNAVIDKRSLFTAVPYVPTMAIPVPDKKTSCKCGSSSGKKCTCKEVKVYPRERIIEEVMGKYFEVKPIDKVFTGKDINFTRQNICKNMNKKNTNSVACQKYSILYNDVNKTEKQGTIIKYGYRSKYVCQDMVDKDNISQSSDDNKCFTADSNLSVKSYPGLVTSVSTNCSETILATQYNLSNFDENCPKTKSNNDCSVVQINSSLYCNKVRTIAEELIKNVMVFGCEFKQESSKEWISLQTFVNEILDKPNMKVDDHDSENNEVELKTEYLENSDILKKEDNGYSKSLDIETIYKNTYYKNTKQMKVEARVQCDDEICVMYRSNLLGGQSSTSKLQNCTVIDEDDLKRINHNTNDIQCNTNGEITVDKELKTDLINAQFQPFLVTKSIKKIEKIKEEFKNNLTISSERYKLDINEHAIELIENILNHNPNAFISLKNTKSGHLILDLNSIGDDDGQSIIIKRSESANMIIEIEKSAIGNLSLPKFNKKILRSNTAKIDNIGMHVPNISKPQCSKNTEISHDAVKKCLLYDLNKGFRACKSYRQRISKDFLLKLYNKNSRRIKINLKQKSNTLTNVQATLLEMSSENIAIHIKNGNILNASKVEFPVLLQRTNSGTIYIDSDVDITSCNGVATRTASNGFLICIKHLNSHEFGAIKKNMPNKQDVFKIKIKGLNIEDTEPPAVIRRTSSGNFDVIFEKEYEKYFQQTIQHLTVHGNESLFNLTETSSGMILDFDKYDNQKCNTQKALLMKSNSGLLKIFVSNDINNEKPKNSEIMSTEAITELLSKLTSSFKLENKPSIHKPMKNNLSKRRSSSDSHLYETAKIKFHSSQSLLENSSTMLKKTPSGQYAVVLDKDLKKSFINNLLSYLDKSSKGVIPIKKSDTGDIIISLDNNARTGKCGTLKITPSGNIYLILDESHIKNISNSVAISTCCSNKSEISPYISKINQPENKAVCTNCNAYPYDNLCDVSKCVCERLYSEKNSFRRSFIDSNKMQCSSECDKQSINSKNSSNPFRSDESHSRPDKHHTFQESYYCEMQSVCPYHKERYQAISNELLEISGLCNQAQQNVLSKKFMVDKKVSYNWNSFEYLPFQLPPFLGNIIYS